MLIKLDALASTFKDVEFFLVCLFPSAPGRFEGSTDTLQLTQTEQFWSVTSKSRQGGQGLVNDVGGAHVLLRGYDSDIGVHTYCAPEQLAAIGAPQRLQNGVFAYMRMGGPGQPAVVRTDAMGVAPFFYRQAGGSWMFASHPALLHMDGDEVDLVAWMSMLQNGLVYGDRSFYQSIRRVAAGAHWELSPQGALSEERWFDLASLPAGEERIDDAAFELVEAAYMEGMEKTMAMGQSRILPFSSGYDSRRFFATMIDKGVPFKAVTCQTFHRKKGRDYDIDSFFAPKIAAAFGVECELVLASSPEQYAADSTRRMALIGTESFMHGWAVPFMDWLAKRAPSIVFDGLAGDTFGNSGYEYPNLHESHARDMEVLMSCTVDGAKFSHVSALFPSREDYMERYRQHLHAYPATLNGAEFAFLQSRTRRCISPWITMMHPPGQVVIFPYYEMAFVRATMRYHPADKYKWFFQKECLRRSYPAYFDFPGSRNVPGVMTPLPAERSAAMDQQDDDFTFGDRSVVLAALKYLSLPNKVLLLLALVFKPLRQRRRWLLGPLLTLVKTQRSHRSFVKL